MKKFELPELIAIVVLVIVAMGNVSVWFLDLGIPDFTVILLSVIFTGTYAGIRLLSFANRPAFNMPYVFRTANIVLMLLMLFGDYVKTEGETVSNIWIIIAILGALGVNALSLSKANNKTS